MQNRYRKYKEATTTFLSWLSSATSSETRTTESILGAMRKATQAALAVPSLVFDELSTAVALRKEAARLHPAPDGQHWHFLDVLSTCMETLRPFVTPRTAPATPPAPRDAPPTKNPFSVLTEDGQGVDREEEPTGKPAPARRRSEAREEAWDGSDQLACIFFLLDMDTLMGHCASAWRAYKAKTCTLLSATLVANACLAQVQALHAQLLLEFPYLPDLSSVLIAAFLDDAVLHAQRASPGAPRSAAVSACALASRITARNAHEIVAQLVRRHSMAQEKAVGVMRKVMDSWEEKREGFFGWSQWLGGDHDLLLVNALLNGLGDVINPKTRLVAKDGFFGKKWNEKVPARSFEELKDFIMADVMPSLCLAGFNSPSLNPRQAVLMPIIPLMKEFTSTRKTSIPLLFAIHNLLWATYCVQGDGDFERVIVSSRLALSGMLKQVEKYIDEPVLQGHYTGAVARKVRKALHYELNERNMLCGEKQQNYSLYNPFMAGQSIVSATLDNDVYCGVAMFDSISQMRLILHLYNAMRITQYIEQPIGILEKLMRISFKIKEAIWVGGVPTETGSFMKAFLLSWGYSLQHASDLALIIQKSPDILTRKMKTEWKNDAIGRTIVPILPENLSVTFKRIIAKDFDGIVTPDFESYLEEIKRSIQEDEVLTLNLFAIGTLLIQSMETIVSALQIKSYINEKVQEGLSAQSKRKKGGKSKVSDDDFLIQGKVWMDRNSKENNEVCWTIYFLKQLLALTDRSKTEDGIVVKDPLLALAAKALVDDVKSWNEKDYLIEINVNPIPTPNVISPTVQVTKNPIPTSPTIQSKVQTPSTTEQQTQPLSPSILPSTETSSTCPPENLPFGTLFCYSCKKVINIELFSNSQRKKGPKAKCKSCISQLEI